MLNNATSVLAMHYGIGVVWPYCPWAFGYKQAYTSCKKALFQIKGAQSWFVVWMGLLSFLITKGDGLNLKKVMLNDQKEKEPSGSHTEEILPAWLTVLEKSNFHQNWLTSIILLTVCSFVKETPCAVIVFSLPNNKNGHPVPEFYNNYGIPYWYPWGMREGADKILAKYAPPSYLLQEAQTLILPNPFLSVEIIGLGSSGNHDTSNALKQLDTIENSDRPENICSIKAFEHKALAHNVWDKFM
ncbi:hypothetical protein BDQ12DRAFT_669704 [Crucibulum laeve]|nr:hypothetical protein BDQ12DRAFT_669704 [Crucibulum laeve]